MSDPFDVPVPESDPELLDAILSAGQLGSAAAVVGPEALPSIPSDEALQSAQANYSRLAAEHEALSSNVDLRLRMDEVEGAGFADPVRAQQVGFELLQRGDTAAVGNYAAAWQEADPSSADMFLERAQQVLESAAGQVQVEKEQLAEQQAFEAEAARHRETSAAVDQLYGFVRRTSELAPVVPLGGDPTIPPAERAAAQSEQMREVAGLLASQLHDLPAAEAAKVGFRSAVEVAKVDELSQFYDGMMGASRLGGLDALSAAERTRFEQGKQAAIAKQFVGAEDRIAGPQDDTAQVDAFRQALVAKSPMSLAMESLHAEMRQASADRAAAVRKHGAGKFQR